MLEWLVDMDTLHWRQLDECCCLHGLFSVAVDDLRAELMRLDESLSLQVCRRV